MKARVILLSGLCSLLAVAGDPADEHTKSATKDESVLHVETRLVEVNVVAQDSKGNAITDLTRDDFTLFDNGKKVPIDVFSAISVETAPTAPTLPPNTFTNRIGGRRAPSNVTVILLDGLNTRVEDQTWARAEVVSFLEKLQPQDRVAIYLLGEHLYILQDFTSNPKILLEILKKAKSRPSKELAGSAGLDATPGAARSVDLETALEQVAGASGSGAGSTGPNTTGLQLGAAASVQAAEEAIFASFEQHEGSFFVVDRVGRTLDALTAIANHLAEFAGRKNLIWVSGSFPVAIGFEQPRQPGDTRDQLAFGPEVERAVRALNNADFAVYPVDARGLIAGGLADGLTSIAGRGVAGEGGLKNPENLYSTYGTMTDLADHTGGRAFFNTNDLAVPMRRAVDDSRADYTLGFYPHIRWDSAYHDLKVKVNRPGVHLRYRRGYYASVGPAAAEDQTTASLRQAIVSPLDSTGVGLTVAIEQRVEQPARRLKLRITADAHNVTFQDKKGGKAASLDFISAQLDTEGKVVSDVRHTVNLTVAEKGMDVVFERGLSFNGFLEVTPGATQLRLVVRDTASGNMGSVTVPLGP